MGRRGPRGSSPSLDPLIVQGGGRDVRPLAGDARGGHVMGDGDVVAGVRGANSRPGPPSDLPARVRRLLRPEVLRGMPGWVYWGLGVGLALAVLGLSRDATQRSR